MSSTSSEERRGQDNKHNVAAASAKEAHMDERNHDDCHDDGASFRKCSKRKRKELLSNRSKSRHKHSDSHRNGRRRRNDNHDDNDHDDADCSVSSSNSSSSYSSSSSSSSDRRRHRKKRHKKHKSKKKKKKKKKHKEVKKQRRNKGGERKSREGCESANEVSSSCHDGKRNGNNTGSSLDAERNADVIQSTAMPNVATIEDATTAATKAAVVPKEPAAAAAAAAATGTATGTAATSPNKPRNMAPMSQHEYDALQSQVRQVYDPESGRYRMIRGTGEVIECIVSRSEHEAINRQATRGDGSSYARHIFNAAAARKK
jgi:Nuclear RNA-splicing-associated protein